MLYPPPECHKWEVQTTDKKFLFAPFAARFVPRTLKTVAPPLVTTSRPIEVVLSVEAQTDNLLRVLYRKPVLLTLCKVSFRENSFIDILLPLIRISCKRLCMNLTYRCPCRQTILLLHYYITLMSWQITDPSRMWPLCRRSSSAWLSLDFFASWRHEFHATTTVSLASSGRHSTGTF